MDLNVGEQKVLVYVLQRKWTDANKKAIEIYRRQRTGGEKT